MKKSLLVLCILLITGVILAACAQPAPTAQQPAAQQPAAKQEAPKQDAAKATGKPFRVAVVTPSAKNDHAFSESIYVAMEQLQKEMGKDKFEYVISENLGNVSDAAAAMRDYASKGYDLILGHGSQYGASVGEIAPDFPNVSFAWGTAVDTFESKGVKNVFAYTVAGQEGAYAMGIAAAMLSKSKTIGLVGPIPAGDGKLFIDGMQAGVKATDPNAKVLVNYINSFGDVSLASQAARTHIDAGADIVAGTSQAMVGAVSVVKEKNVGWMGSQSDWASAAPKNVMASQVYDWTVAIKPIIQDIQNGTKGTKVYTLTMANKGLFVKFNPDYKDPIPDAVKQAVDKASKDIAAGTLKVPVQ